MNKEEAREMVKIFQAFADGENVVFNFRDNSFDDATTLVAAAVNPANYKIVKGPRVIYVNKVIGGKYYCYNSKELASEWTDVGEEGYEYNAVKFVEETDE